MRLNKSLGLMLYWGEGDKAKANMVALTNTDPKILIYFSRWLRKYYILDKKRLRGRIYIWEDLDENKAKQFWSDILKIPQNQFTKSYISKSKPKIRKARHINGVCRLSYCSAEIFNNIKDSIKKEFH